MQIQLGNRYSYFNNNATLILFILYWHYHLILIIAATSLMMHGLQTLAAMRWTLDAKRSRVRLVVTWPEGLTGVP